MTTTLIPASDKQISFVSDLIANRQMTTDERDTFVALMSAGLGKQDASMIIDTLVKRSKVAKAKSTAPSILAGIPKSKYAIPVAELEFSDADDSFTGDIVFLEIKEYMETLYMRQLHGAPGRFNRSKLTSRSVKAIAEILKSDPYKYAKFFGEHYACCGSCGADLTDPRSRELQLGPECRKKFGY